ASAMRNIDAWIAEADGAGLDAILVNASGCGTTVKDYGFMFRDDAEWAAKAARVSALARDVTEYLVGIGLASRAAGATPSPDGPPEGLAVAYHSACSMQHGQKVTREPHELLRAA